MDYYLGYHGCEICAKDDNVPKPKDDLTIYNMFDGSLKIAYNNKIYCCPNGVEHYIEKHDYRPADEVIKAILNGHYYTGEELKEIGKKDPEVKLAIKQAEERVKKCETKWKNKKRIEDIKFKKSIGIKKQDMKKMSENYQNFKNY